MQFTKLFSNILDSTIWMEPPSTKIVWITMLAMSDRNGEVHASVPGLARRAGVSREEADVALETFLSPDPDSRTDVEEGRRVRKIDGGWELINHGKYRKLLSSEERREYNRQKQAEYRARKKAEGVKDVSAVSNNVNHGQSLSAKSTHTEAEAEAEAEVSLAKANSCSFSQKLHDHFRKRKSTAWKAKERNAFKRAKGAKSDEEFEAEIDEVIAYEKQAGQYQVRGLTTLLNKWEEKVSEARMSDATKTVGNTEPTIDTTKLRFIGKKSNT